MSAPKFTPGPWHYDGMADATIAQARRLEIPFMVRARGCSVAEVIPQQPAEANARLIAAAPELYEALKDIVDQLEKSKLPIGVDLADSIRVFGRAALAKAEGKK